MLSVTCLSAGNPSPMTGEGNNTYLLVGSDRSATLIDAGVGHEQHLSAIARETASADAVLTQVLVTHAHVDHVSGAPILQRAYPSARFLKFPNPGADAGYDVAWQPLADLDAIAVGSESLTVLHTPGHAPDHVALWHEATATVFTGDLVVSGSTVMIHASGGGNLAQYLASLERLLELRPSRLLPAHGPEITDPPALLNQYIRHRRQREAQVLAAIANGRRSVESIVESIYDGLAPALVPAARETVRAHLAKLKAEGRVSEEHGVWKAR